MEMFADEIIGKVATTTGGYPVGPIVDIVFDTGTGVVKYLLVNVTSSLKTQYDLDDRGRAIIPFNTLKVSEKNVVFSK